MTFVRILCIGGIERPPMVEGRCIARYEFFWCVESEVSTDVGGLLATHDNDRL